VGHFPVALADHVRGDLGSDGLQTDVAKHVDLLKNKQHQN
jgi:hypothetical protein